MFRQVLVRSLALISLVWLMPSPAEGQVASLGKGWLLDAGGSITSEPREVVSGRHSIKGSSSSVSTFTRIIWTDPVFIPLRPNETYTVLVSYRVLSDSPGGFELAFFSPNANRDGRFGPGTTIRGATGAQGTATLTGTLLNYSDYQVGLSVQTTGSIALDDISIRNGAGQLIASENAEGPTVVPGPLGLQLTDATTLFTPSAGVLRSGAATDLDGDSYPEAILTLTAPNPSTIPLPAIVVEASAAMRVATSQFFPAGAPSVRHSPMTLFADLTGDGLQDIVFSDAGGDPFGAGRIGVALNVGGGKYRDVSDLIPKNQWTTRSYAVAVGDVLNDGRTAIILPDENDGANTALLRWNGDGFDEIRNWIPQSIWRGFPYNLHRHSWMNLADLDNDGYQDLLVSGQQNAPNIQLVFGANDGFANARVITLPDGPWGHTPAPFPPAAQGAEVQPIVVADFNNDGLADIFSAERKVMTYQPGAFNDTSDPDYAGLRANGGVVYSDASFRVLINQGSRKFVDVTAPTYVNLGNRTYFSLLRVDIDNDGFLDVVGEYQARLYPTHKQLWGTTFFLNDGTGAFRPVDGSEIVGVTTSRGEQRWSLGSFMPTVVSPTRTEGIVAESVGGCGGPGYCALPALNIYKVVANGSLGTGPEFTDPAHLGVPGFNELYYLNHYPDAAAAVRAGAFRNGLEHYRAIGATQGYQPRARNNAIPQGVSVWDDSRTYRITYQADGNVVMMDRRQRPVWATNTGGTMPGTFVMRADGNLVLKDGKGTIRWESHTSGHPGAYFVVQGDGNFVIYSATGEPLWDRSQSR